MGTLFNQAPRQDHLKGYMKTVAEALDVMRIEREHATPEDWQAAASIARVALAIQSADTLDEQIAGFGEILDRIRESLRELAEASRTRGND